MSEEKIAEPKHENNSISEASDKDTTPETEELVIPVKYNKETKMLTVGEASRLAQLGLKFETVSENYDTLKKLAQSEKKSVAGYLDSLKTAIVDSRRNVLLSKCGGDAELAEHILNLERDGLTQTNDGFEELKEFFPSFKDRSDLPAEVIENAALKGTLLLDEYLRFCLKEKFRIKEAARLQKSAEISSTGSQINRNGYVDPEVTEFLRGIWKR